MGISKKRRGQNLQMVNYKVRSLALEAAFTIGAAMETELPHKLSSSFIKASPGNEAQHKT